MRIFVALIICCSFLISCAVLPFYNKPPVYIVVDSLFAFCATGQEPIKYRRIYPSSYYVEFYYHIEGGPGSVVFWSSSCSLLPQSVTYESGEYMPECDGNTKTFKGRVGSASGEDWSQHSSAKIHLRLSGYYWMCSENSDPVKIGELVWKDTIKVKVTQGEE